MRQLRSVAGPDGPTDAAANNHFQLLLRNASQLSIILIALAVGLAVLQAGQVILAPVFLAITVGLMFGPIADAMEKRGVPSTLSAAVVVLLLLAIIVVSGGLFAAPLAEWVARIPVIWERLRTELANLREPIAAFGALQEQVKDLFGGDGAMAVTVEDGGAVTELALLAPAILAQMLLFLASLYFFMATRESIRISTLSLCVSRRMRWRTAHVFRDVELKVSKYLLTISMVNIGVGVVVAAIMWAIGMPSPLLWGALAAVLNYIPFIGQAVMALILFMVGLATQSGIGGAMLPVVLYWVVNFVEGNLVIPNLLGRAMTMNPFVIFLSLAFWIWSWGPVGGLIAVPSLLILYSLVTHILPVRQAANRPNRRTIPAGSQPPKAIGEKPAVGTAPLP